MVILLDPTVPSDSMESGRRERVYTFDYAFDESVGNKEIYASTGQKLVSAVLSGYNATCFAYGQTGAGKTYTMMGSIEEAAHGGPFRVKGIYTLTIEDIMQRIESDSSFSYAVSVSFLEIYNERIIDLLNPGQEHLDLMEDPVRGMVVHELVEIKVNSAEELHQLILKGEENRKFAPTGANLVSSRSHAILQILVEKRSRARDIVEDVSYSKLSLIDLAGSERAAVTENRGIRMVEGANINRSLLALGNCINILGDKNKRGAFVPYRDSKLTRLLKDSLGGNTRTVMIANVSPACMCYEETHNTLKYADRAKNIKRKVVTNRLSVMNHISQYKKIIESLRAEIEILKARVSESGSDDDGLGQRRALSAPLVSGRPASAMSEATQARLTPIEKELLLQKEAKKDLEKQISRCSDCSGEEQPGEGLVDDADFERFSRELVANFQEQMEVKTSLLELEDLNSQNAVVVDRIKDRVRWFQIRMETAESETEVRGLQTELMRSLHEIETIERNTSDNERVRQKMTATLLDNEAEKYRLQEDLLKLKAGNRRSLLELHTNIQQLKLEKMDLHIKNLELKKAQVIGEQENELTQNKIQSLQAELESLRAELKHVRQNNNNNNSSSNSNNNNTHSHHHSHSNRPQTSARNKMDPPHLSTQQLYVSPIPSKGHHPAKSGSAAGELGRMSLPPMKEGGRADFHSPRQVDIAQTRMDQVSQRSAEVRYLEQPGHSIRGVIDRQKEKEKEKEKEPVELSQSHIPVALNRHTPPRPRQVSSASHSNPQGLTPSPARRQSSVPPLSHRERTPPRLPLQPATRISAREVSSSSARPVSLTSHRPHTSPNPLAGHSTTTTSTSANAANKPPSLSSSAFSKITEDTAHVFSSSSYHRSKPSEGGIQPRDGATISGSGRPPFSFGSSSHVSPPSQAQAQHPYSSRSEIGVAWPAQHKANPSPRESPYAVSSHSQSPVTNTNVNAKETVVRTEALRQKKDEAATRWKNETSMTIQERLNRIRQAVGLKQGQGSGNSSLAPSSHAHTNVNASANAHAHAHVNVNVNVPSTISHAGGRKPALQENAPTSNPAAAANTYANIAPNYLRLRELSQH